MQGSVEEDMVNVAHGLRTQKLCEAPPDSLIASCQRECWCATLSLYCMLVFFSLWGCFLKRACAPHSLQNQLSISHTNVPSGSVWRGVQGTCSSTDREILNIQDYIPSFE